MPVIQNPVLPGFHPDPCIIRARGYYYLATSTFEWWPGVRIHRSSDLGSWELVGYALERKSQADLRGDPDSGGVWAPGLTYADDKFWLTYSDVKCHSGPFKDVRNFLCWSDHIEGPWSDPIALNRSGFDPSLFHDADGRKWLLNQLWKTSDAGDAFAGIVIQEYSHARKALLGKPELIFGGTGLGITEGPHIYRKDGYYYLITAEGGTDWNHAVSVARSRTLHGPYEVCPANPLLTSDRRFPDSLQKAGHGSLVQSEAGDWYLAHLCSRPVGGRNRCILGRETAIQAVVWNQGEWPRLAAGGRYPSPTFSIPAGEGKPYSPAFFDDFASAELNKNWNTLREPPDTAWLSLTERRGYLRLRGRNSLGSLFDQSVVGSRILHHRCRVATCLEFSPRTFLQAAGLALYYDTSNFYYASITADAAGRRILILWASDNRTCRRIFSLELPDSCPPAVKLAANLDGEQLRFSLGWEGSPLREVGPPLDATILSDDYPAECGRGLAFTGAFAVLCAQDSSADRVPADFKWFSYTTNGATSPEPAHGEAPP